MRVVLMGVLGAAAVGAVGGCGETKPASVPGGTGGAVAGGTGGTVAGGSGGAAAGGTGGSDSGGATSGPGGASAMVTTTGLQFNGSIAFTRAAR
jgi:hypothetical protein